jgi:cardiolipin synthase
MGIDRVWAGDARSPGSWRDTAQVVTSRSGPGLTRVALAVVGLLRTARRRVRITTPYVRLPPRLHDLLAATVARGVQVQIVLNGPHHDRAFVQRQPRHPRLHPHSQIAVVVDDPATAAVIDAHLDLADSHRLDDREWRRRGLGRPLLEVGADLVATTLRGGFGAAGLTARRR